MYTILKCTKHSLTVGFFSSRTFVVRIIKYVEHDWKTKYKFRRLYTINPMENCVKLPEVGNKIVYVIEYQGNSDRYRRHS